MTEAHRSVDDDRQLDVEVLTRFHGTDLDDLCRATRAIIDEGSESSFAGAPTEARLSSFWTGVALAPHRILVVGRFDGVISGAFQLVRQGTLSEVGPYVAELRNFFVAPWARGHGLARVLMEEAERVASENGIRIIDLSVRASRKRAVALFEALGYKRWAEKPHFALVDGHFVPGYYYSKPIGSVAP